MGSESNHSKISYEEIRNQLLDDTRLEQKLYGDSTKLYREICHSFSNSYYLKWAGNKFAISVEDFTLCALGVVLEEELSYGLGASLLRLAKGQGASVSGVKSLPSSTISSFKFSAFQRVSWRFYRLLFLGKLFLKSLRRFLVLVRLCFFRGGIVCPSDKESVLVGWSGDIKDIGVKYGKYTTPGWVSNRFGKLKVVGATGVLSFVSGIERADVVFPMILNFRRRVKFVVQAVGLLITSLFYSILRVDVTAILTLRDSLECVYMKLVEHYPKQYFYLNSCFRSPLWSHVVPEHAKPTLLCYSTNFDRLSLHGYNAPENISHWYFNRWERVFVWTESQKSWFEEVQPYSIGRVNVVQPVPFIDNGEECDVPERSLVVLDVSPFPKWKYDCLGAVLPYYNVEISKWFFSDILSVCEKLGVWMVFKQKRISPHLDPSYINLLCALRSSPFCVEASPGVSADRLIKNSSAVVCMPFSSPGVLAKHEGVPSCYFDPTEMLIPDQRTAGGVRVVSGISALEAWVSAEIGLTL